jgi:hypothetical protein
MESLALVVSFMLLGQLLLGVATIVFAGLARFRARFRRTALVLMVVLAIESAWALSVLVAFGLLSLGALGVAAVLFWWPKRAGRP